MNRNMEEGMPSSYRDMLDTYVPPRDVPHIAKCFEDTISTSWDLIGELYMELSPGDVENIRQEQDTRAMQVGFC